MHDGGWRMENGVWRMKEDGDGDGDGCIMY